MHIFKPWKKDVQSCIKICMKLYKELCLQRYPLSIQLIISYNLRSENDKVHKVEKVTKINSRIISKPHAYLQTMEKTCAKFQKVRYKIVGRVALTIYKLSENLRSENYKVHKVEKVTKIKARIISKSRAHLQTMENTCAKFQKDLYKIVKLYIEVEK